MLALTLTLTACTTPGRISTAPLWAPKLTESEQLHAQRIERVMVAMCESARAKGATCSPPGIHVVSGSSQRADYYAHANYLALPRAAVGFQAEGWLPLVSHELAHWYFADARLPTCGEPVTCERNANARAVTVLRFFGYSESMATLTIHTRLLALVREHTATTPEHPDWCGELRDFERRFGIPTSACQEK